MKMYFLVCLLVVLYGTSTAFATNKNTIKVKKMTVIATAYCDCVICTGKNPGNPGYGITASGLKTRYGLIAVDKKFIKLGTKVKVRGRHFVAADTGSAIKGKRIDIYMKSHQDALEFGRRKVDVYF